MGVRELEEDTLVELQKAHHELELILNVELKKLDREFGSLTFEGPELKGRIVTAINAIKKALNNTMDEESFIAHIKVVSDKIEEEKKKS